MPGNSFGELFKVTTSGVSHGPGYVAIIDGCPPGLPLGIEDLIPDLQRRKPGQSKITTQRKEDDLPEILSGFLKVSRMVLPLAFYSAITISEAMIMAISKINTDRAMQIILLMPSMGLEIIEVAVVRVREKLFAGWLLARLPGNYLRLKGFVYWDM